MTTARADMAVLPALPSFREAGLWMGAAFVVLATHALIAYALQVLQPAGPPEASQPALAIDLMPLPISTPQSVQSETLAEEPPLETLQPVEDAAELAREEVAQAVTPQAEPERLEPEAIKTVKPDVVETVKPETVTAEDPREPETEEAEPVVPERSEPELTAPEIAEIVTPEVVLPLPEPRPVVEEQPKEQPKKKAEPRRAEKKTAEREAPRKKEAAKAKPAPKANASQESRASKAPKVSPAKWQSKVLAWLNRHKRYPRGAKSRGEQGQVRVSFAINASGSVISARVARSSGNSELDQAALDMVRRASPVPAPPPEIARSRMSLSLPVQFSLR